MANFVAVVAFPVKAAVIVPAANPPLASLATIVLIALVAVAVVAVLATFPAVAMVASFVSSILAPASILVFEIPEIVLAVASIVLLVKASAPSKVASTPAVGNVTTEAAVVFKVILEALEAVVPVVVKLAPVLMVPPRVTVLLLSLATPVPPLMGLMTPVMLWPFTELPEISAMVANVPEVGKVKTVVPLVLKVMSEALEPVVPVVVKFLPRVIVLPVLFTPVPPLAPAMTPVTELADILLMAVDT